MVNGDKIPGNPIDSPGFLKCSLLLDLLFQSLKLRTVKKLGERNIQPVTQLFDCNHGNVVPLIADHAVYSGGGDTGTSGQLIEADMASTA